MIKDITPIYSKGSEDPKQDKHKENHGRRINSFLPVFQRQSKNLTSNQIKGSLASSHHKQWEPVDNVIFNVLKENYQPKIIYIRYSSKMEVKEKYLYKKRLLSVYYVPGIVPRVQQ